MGNRKKNGIVLALALLMGIGGTLSAQAGSINENEQSVISTANGRFEKDGVIYEVKPEYINSLSSYLAQDDVELTSEQAQAAISEIYANVQTGIESGYLEEVGRTSTEAKEPMAPSSPAQEETKENASEENTSEENKPEENKSEEEKETQTQESKQVEKVPEVISILELVDRAPVQNYEYIYTDTNALVKKINLPYKLLWASVGFSTLLTVVTLVISIWKHYLTQHKDQRLRRILKRLLTAALILLTFVFCIGGGLWFGAFQENSILNRLGNSGYYTSIYKELQKDTSISFALLNIPTQVMDHSITYEKVVIAARQQVESDLKEGTYKADTSILIEPLKSDIEQYLKGQSITMTKEAEEGLELLMERLNGKYTALLQWPFSQWWTQMKAEFVREGAAAVVTSFFLGIAAQVLLIFLYHYKYRGLVLGAKGIIGGSILGFLLFSYGGMMAYQKWNPISPGYMNSFFKMYGASIWKTGAAISCIGILAGLVEIAVAKSWREGK